MEAIFAEHGPRAVGVKTQHAYNRTLQWQARDDADAARALEKHLAGAELPLDEALCLGDWCLARGIELAIPPQPAGQDSHRLLRGPQPHARRLHPARTPLRTAGDPP